MAEQAGERRVTAEVGAELISLMVPNVDLELVQLMLSRAARSAVGGHADHKGDRGGVGKPQTPLLREYAELLALIRDAGIDRTQLCTILGLDPEPCRPATTTRIYRYEKTSPIQDLGPGPEAMYCRALSRHARHVT